MSKVTLLYLFFQTLAVSMLMAILTSKPDGDTLQQYERFSYAIGAFGFALFTANQWRKRFPSAISNRKQIILTACLYPLMLFIINAAVEHSPKLITEAARPNALQRGVKTLSDPSIENLNFASQFSNVTKRLPIPEATITELYLESINGLSQLIQHRERWSKDFSEKKFKESVIFISHKNRNMSRYEDKLETSYIFSVASGAILPLTSKTFTQIGHLGRLQKSSLYYIEPLVNSIILYRLGLENSNQQQLNAITSKPPAEARETNKTKRTLLLLEKEIKAQKDIDMFELIPHQPGWSALDTIRRSFTLHILAEAGLDTHNLPEDILFPFNVEGQPYNADVEFIKLIRWYAPFLVDSKGKLIISLQDLANAQQIQRYENVLSQGLPDSFKNNFYRFYHNTANGLSKTPAIWQLPIAMPLFGHFVRIGKILPWVALISFVLLLAHIVLISRHSVSCLLKALAVTGSAFFIFFTPLLHWIMQPVLWFSF